MQKTSRRQFLKVGAGLGALTVLAACAPVATDSGAGGAAEMEEPSISSSGIRIGTAPTGSWDG